MCPKHTSIQSYSKFFISFSIAGFEQAFAAPVSELQTRATGTRNSDCDPIEATLNVRGEDALTFDADCWAMLCGGKDPIM